MLKEVDTDVVSKIGTQICFKMNSAKLRGRRLNVGPGPKWFSGTVKCFFLDKRVFRRHIDYIKRRYNDTAWFPEVSRFSQLTSQNNEGNSLPNSSTQMPSERRISECPVNEGNKLQTEYLNSRLQPNCIVSSADHSQHQPGLLASPQKPVRFSLRDKTSHGYLEDYKTKIG